MNILPPPLSMIRQNLRLSIKVSSILFGLNLLHYLYNPYYLLRPHQIEQDNNVDRIILNGPSNKIENVPNEVYDLLDIANATGTNFSTTRETRVKLFLQGIGNCSHQSSGMGEVLSNDNFNYSIVHFLPKTGLYEGNGHTILNVIRDSISFLVDPIMKMVPIVEDEMHNKRLMNIQDLYNRSNIYQMNSHKSVANLSNEFWEPNFTAAYAEVRQSEMEKYYSSAESLLRLLGLHDDSNSKRLLVNGVILVCGDLPTFKVNQDDYIKLCRAYPNFVFLKYLGRFFVYNLYCLSLLVFIYVVKFKILRLN